VHASVEYPQEGSIAREACRGCWELEGVAYQLCDEVSMVRVCSTLYTKDVHTGDELEGLGLSLLVRHIYYRGLWAQSAYEGSMVGCRKKVVTG
jgi:hypothetical protein